MCACTLVVGRPRAEAEAAFLDAEVSSLAFASASARPAVRDRARPRTYRRIHKGYFKDDFPKVVPRWATFGEGVR